MLNGIGGRTVFEARQNLSYAEFLSWIKYRNRFGMMHYGMRLDRASGRLGSFFGNMLGKSKELKPEDFSPFDREPESDEPASIEAIFNLLQSTVKKDK